MRGSNLQDIEDIFHSALGVEVSERKRFLVDVCSGDDSLRDEVEGLLRSFEDDTSFFDEPAFGLGIKVLQDKQTKSLVGKTIGDYRVVEHLGSGGMGDVYSADDTKLQRRVALKFLNGSFVHDKWARRQFFREAQAVAKLDHPNVCQVYGLETIGKYCFIVMQYIAGETLSDLVKRRKLEVAEVTRIALQICEAVGFAHSYGIIHRDIKGGNIMVGTGGQAKVLDFGLAQSVTPPIATAVFDAEPNSYASSSGLIVGTVACMSPEQLRGEKLDFRSDIYSLGVVLYELATGIHPFGRGTDAETIAAILTAPPVDVQVLAPACSRSLANIIHRCLEKDKDLRFQSASELLLELQSSATAPRRGIPRSARTYVRAAAGVAVLSTFLAGVAYHRSAAINSVAILPFDVENPTSGNEYLREGLPRSLVRQLSATNEVDVKPFTQGLPSGVVDFPALGERYGIEAVVVGSIRCEGDNCLATAEMRRTRDSAKMWSTTVEFEEAKSSHAERRIAEELREALGARSAGDALISIHNENQGSHTAYLKGLFYSKRRDPVNVQKAISFFNEAIELDPTNAEAYAGLADCYLILSTVAVNRPIAPQTAVTRARYAAEQALRIDATSSDAHVALGTVALKYDWNWGIAGDHYRRAIELDPKNFFAHYSYSELLMVQGNIAVALEAALRARELDPLAPVSEINIARIHYYGRDFDQAEAQLGIALDADPENFKALYIRGLIELHRGRNAEAIALFEKLYERNKFHTFSMLGLAYGRGGRKQDAVRMLEELEAEASRNTYFPSIERAFIYIGLGQKDRAVSILEAAFAERSYPVAGMKMEPLFDELRSEPRFVDLVGQLQF